jgi:hypothetical protein
MRFALILGSMALLGCSAATSPSGDNTFQPVGIAGQQNGAAGVAGSAEILEPVINSGPQIYVTPVGEDDGATGSEPAADMDGGPQIGDGSVCGSITVKADVEIIKQSGNLLVLFDRSNSMSDDWNALPRYQAAGQALIAGITPLQDLLVMGGIFFPCVPPENPDCDPTNWTDWLPGGACSNASANSCEVTEITSTDQISFRSALEFITELPKQWFLQGTQGTPLGAAVVRADAALSTSTFTGATAVLVMTDGEPNCQTVNADVISAVTKWNTNGIKTYVVGLPGSTEASAFLTQVAVAGGTTDFISPDDPSALQTEISTIVTDTVKTSLKSCTINLQQDASADLANLHLIASENGKEGEILKQFPGGGWSVSADGAVATLEGKLCEYAQNGRFESIRFDFGCVVVPIILN